MTSLEKGGRKWCKECSIVRKMHVIGGGGQKCPKMGWRHLWIVPISALSSQWCCSAPWQGTAAAAAWSRSLVSELFRAWLDILLWVSIPAHVSASVWWRDQARHDPPETEPDLWPGPRVPPQQCDSDLCHSAPVSWSPLQHHHCHPRLPQESLQQCLDAPALWSTTHQLWHCCAPGGLGTW